VSGALPTPIKQVDPAARLAELEEDIGLERDAGRRLNAEVYFTAGDCLRAIRDEELYRVRKHRTFGAYLRARWRMSDEEAEWIMNCTDESQRILKFVREHEGKPVVRAVDTE
jgi:hypothetical protein